MRKLSRHLFCLCKTVKMVTEDNTKGVKLYYRDTLTHWHRCESCFTVVSSLPLKPTPALSLSWVHLISLCRQWNWVLHLFKTKKKRKYQPTKMPPVLKKRKYQPTNFSSSTVVCVVILSTIFSPVCLGHGGTLLLRWS